jgi:hypothetical protein
MKQFAYLRPGGMVIFETPNPQNDRWGAAIFILTPPTAAITEPDNEVYDRIPWLCRRGDT